MSSSGPEVQASAVAADDSVVRASREATPKEVVEFALQRVVDPVLGQAARVALRQLLGDEPASRGIGTWHHDRIIKRIVKRLVPRQRDPETVTEVGDRLVRRASRFVKPHVLTDEQCARLRSLAATGKPSEITRTLLAWRYDLPDRTVRRL